MNCTQDLIDQYDHVAEPFFAQVLAMNYGDFLITDESTLSDFTMANMPRELISPKASYKQLRNNWDTFVKSRIRECFGIELSSTVIRLVDLFRRIDMNTGVHVLH